MSGLDFDVKFEHRREYTAILIPAHKLAELKAKLLVIAEKQAAELQAKEEV